MARGLVLAGILLAATEAIAGCNAISGLGDYEVTEAAGSGGAAGAPGTGGGGGCATAGDCPAPEKACETATCKAGVCGTAPVAGGEPSGTQTPGDCKVVVCGSDGTTMTTPDLEDVPDDGNECTEDLCDEDGMPGSSPVAAGASCTKGGKVCDGAGACVECNMDKDCAMGACSMHKCVPILCTDGTKNGQETDVDCGGPECSPCADTLDCMMGTDCLSGVCQNGVCQGPTCSDSIKNGAETGVDCGPGCPGCPAGEGCGNGGDCQSGVCLGGICQAPTCSDGVQNGGETNIDCGGGGCSGCGDGQPCGADAECASGWCNGNACQATLSIVVEGHANVSVKCVPGDFMCQGHLVCNGVTGYDCIYQDYECCTGAGGSWYPPDGQSGSSQFNFAIGYDTCPQVGDYGNICACNSNQMTVYGLAANHVFCGLGVWYRQ